MHNLSESTEKNSFLTSRGSQAGKGVRQPRTAAATATVSIESGCPRLRYARVC